MNKTYIGYDLGDGETIANYINTDVSTGSSKSEIADVTMPGQNTAGLAIPTTYAYKKNTKDLVFAAFIMMNDDEVDNVNTNFKRRPTDLLPQLSDVERNALETEFIADTREWPLIAEAQTPALINYKNHIVKFTNGVFLNPDFVERIRTASKGSVQIVVSIGHPTKWGSLDCAIYRKILMQTVLGESTYIGIPLKILLAGESRAAFLYVKDAYDMSRKLTEHILLMDVGSSTIDITALAGGDSRSCSHNDGHNYLGARIIDYFIFEWFKNEIIKKGYEEDYQDKVANNPTYENAVLLKCRKAKEDLFSTDSGMVNIYTDWFKMKLSREEIDGMMSRPMEPILTKYLKISEDIRLNMGNRSYKEELERFLLQERSIMKEKGLKLNQIILTGSASKMPAVREITQKVFAEVTAKDIFMDMDPSKTISKGLALVGISNDKSEEFQNDARLLVKNTIPQIAKENMPKLAMPLAKAVTDIICDDIVLPELKKWRDGKYTALQDAMDEVQKKCDEKSLANLLNTNQKCKDIITGWVVDIIGAEMAIEIKKLCIKYKIKDFDVNDLNVMNMNVKGSQFGKGISESVSDKILSPADMLVNIVAVITGIIVAIITPFALGILVGLLSWISVSIAGVIFSVLIALPGLGWAALLAITGLAGAYLVKHSFEEVKDKISDKIIESDLPQMFRNRIKDKKLTEAISSNKEKIATEIENSMCSDQAVSTIEKQICTVFENRVKVIIDNIRYIIESN
jgi:hypothetical protein